MTDKTHQNSKTDGDSKSEKPQELSLEELETVMGGAGQGMNPGTDEPKEDPLVPTPYPTIGLK